MCAVHPFKIIYPGLGAVHLTMDNNNLNSDIDSCTSFNGPCSPNRPCLAVVVRRRKQRITACQAQRTFPSEIGGGGERDGSWTERRHEEEADPCGGAIWNCTDWGERRENERAAE